MIEWEKIADSEPWNGSFYSSARLKVYGGWLVHTSYIQSDEPGVHVATVFVPDTHHCWKIEGNKND